MKFIILAALFVVAATYCKDSTDSTPVYSATALETVMQSSLTSASKATYPSSALDSSYSSPSFYTPTYSELTYATVDRPMEATLRSVYSEISERDDVHVNASDDDDEGDDDDDDDDDDDGDDAETELHAEFKSLTQKNLNYITTSLFSSSNGKPKYTTAPAYQDPGTVTSNKELSGAVASVYETPVTASSFYEENATIPPDFLPYWLRSSAAKSY